MRWPLSHLVWGWEWAAGGDHVCRSLGGKDREGKKACSVLLSVIDAPMALMKLTLKKTVHHQLNAPQIN